MQVYLGDIDRRLLAQELADMIIERVSDSEGIDYGDLEDVASEICDIADSQLDQYGITIDFEMDMVEDIEADMWGIVNDAVEEIKERQEEEEEED